MSEPGGKPQIPEHFDHHLKRLVLELKDADRYLPAARLPQPTLEELSETIDHLRATTWAVLTSIVDEFSDAQQAPTLLTAHRLQRTRALLQALQEEIDTGHLTFRHRRHRGALLLAGSDLQEVALPALSEARPGRAQLRRPATLLSLHTPTSTRCRPEQAIGHPAAPAMGFCPARGGREEAREKRAGRQVSGLRPLDTTQGLRCASTAARAASSKAGSTAKGTAAWNFWRADCTQTGARAQSGWQSTA